MRISLFAHLPPSPSLISSPLVSRVYHTPLASWFPCRGIHGTPRHSKDPEIFKNSLERTLEAHRSSNRASIFRKVFSKTPSKGIFRPDIRYEKVPSDTTPPSSPSTAAQKAPPTPGSAGRVKREVRTSRKNVASSSRRIPQQQVRWGIDVENGLPEQSPWMDHVALAHEKFDGLSQLDAEIRALERYLAPTTQEQDNVNRVLAEVSGLLAGTVPQSPQVVGSWRTGFAMSHSNLSFVLPVPDAARSIERIRKPSARRPQVLDVYNDLLRRVEMTLQNCPSFEGRVQLYGKRTLVLTAIHVTGLQLHFHCGEGLPSSIEYIQDYHAEYPSLRPLYMTSRLILEAQGLFGSHNSSIDSDALIMLLAGFLKMNHGRFQRPGSLGTQLLEFLQLYGTAVDFTTTGVSVDPPCFFDADSIKEATDLGDPESIPAHIRGQRSLINTKRTAAAKRNRPAVSKLCLQDPANYMNDLGRTCSRTPELQHAFKLAYQQLKASIDAGDSLRHEGQRGSVLIRALQANFDDFKKVRARIASAGRLSSTFMG